MTGVAVALPGAKAALASERGAPASVAFLQFSGYGDGYGEGMGQWGAYGYASKFGWGYQQILAHYYGGTVLGRLPSPEPEVKVQLSELEGKDVVVEALAGGVLQASWPGAPQVASPAFLVARHGSTDLLSAGASCAGPWHRLAALDDGVLSLRAPEQGELRVCLVGGKPRTYQGRLVVGPGPAAYNVVPLEDYVDGVVPAEAPASWAETGGEAALEAQAVAARSYAVATMRSVGYICDTAACQVYAGLPQQYGMTADAAVSATKGIVLYCKADSACGPAGAVALAQYSASTGGYSAGGTFPAVVDLGDSLASNPLHSWTEKVPLSRLDRRFGSLGEPLSVQVARRNGLGALGGRALLVVVKGSDGSLRLSGASFAAALGLPSDWFRVGPLGGQPVATPPTGPASTSVPPVSTTVPASTSVPLASTTVPASTSVPPASTTTTDLDGPGGRD